MRRIPIAPHGPGEDGRADVRPAAAPVETPRATSLRRWLLTAVGASVLAGGGVYAATGRPPRAPGPLIVPGSPLVRGEVIAPGVDTTLIAWTEGGRPQRQLSIAVTRVEAGNPQRLVREERYRDLRHGDDLYHMTMERASLRPIAASVRRRGMVHDLAFRDTRIRATSVKGGDTARRDVRFPRPIFMSASIDMLLASLPRRAGFTARVTLLNEETLAYRELPVRVVGRRTVRLASGGSCATWEIAVGDELRRTLWMEERTGRMARYADARGLTAEATRCPARGAP